MEVDIKDFSSDFTSRYYLIESVDEILNVFGENCIIRGCGISNITFDLNTQYLRFAVDSGTVISDRKLIKFPTETLMELDISNLPPTGKLLVLVSYRYLRTSRPNLAIICIKYVDENDYCENWWEELDGLILTSIIYDKVNNTFTKFESDFVKERKVLINGHDRVVRKLDNITSNLRDFYGDAFRDIKLIIDAFTSGVIPTFPFDSP